MSTYAERDSESIDVNHPAETIQPDDAIDVNDTPTLNGVRVLKWGFYWDEEELDDDGESAWERSCEDYYGGSGPQTLPEQMAEARRLK